MVKNLVTTKWTQKSQFETDNPSGYKFTMFDKSQDNGDVVGFAPKALMLSSLAGCSGLDVVSLLEKMMNYIEGTTIHLSLYHKDEWVVPADDYWAKREAHNTKVDPSIAPLEQTLANWKKREICAHKVMCMGEEEEIEVLYQQLQLHQNEINAYRSKSTYIEVSHIEQDKASALALLLKEKFPQIEMGHVVAFGDNYNDATLLKKVGVGVAVANAKGEILNKANEITKANIEDGVALFLEKELLK